MMGRNIAAFLCVALVGFVSFAIFSCSGDTESSPGRPNGNVIISVHSQESSLSRAGSETGLSGPAFTVIPASFEEYLYYKLTFTDPDEVTSEETFDGDTTATYSFIQGNWTVDLEGYVDAEYQDLAATGYAEFTVTSGDNYVDIELVGNAEADAGTGALDYLIKFSDGEPPDTATMELIPEWSECPVSLEDGGNVISGNFESITAGYWVVVIEAKRGAEVIGYRDLIHIYPGVTTSLHLTFSDEDYSAGESESEEDAEFTIRYGDLAAEAFEYSEDHPLELVNTDEPVTIELIDSDWDNPKWYVDSNPTALEGLSFEIVASDYTTGNHFLTFIGEQNGIPWSKTIRFKVTD
jgi:hypothetical protein